MVVSIRIADRTVGPGHACFIIAEAGVNHNGDPTMARRLVDAAADAGADAVKFQSFTADALVTPKAPKAAYQLATTNPQESQYDMLQRLELRPAVHRELIDHCHRRNILFLSSPFDETAADLLGGLDVPAFKLGSGEVTNWPLIEHVARKGKPVILSTGMSDLEETADAVRVARKTGNDQVAVLHCVSQYPAAAADANLLAMETMRRELGVPVGFSDHTRGLEVSLAAAALGANIIEKHFTLDRALPGPDHAASLDAGELAALVGGIRLVEAALGDGVKRPRPAEEENRRIVRRSLAAAGDLPAGTRLARESVACLRPGTGLPPKEIARVVGRRLRRTMARGDLLDWGDLE